MSSPYLGMPAITRQGVTDVIVVRHHTLSGQLPHKLSRPDTKQMYIINQIKGSIIKVVLHGSPMVSR